MHTRVSLNDNNSVSVGGVEISFHRTLRVPDQKGTKNSLPPVRGFSNTTHVNLTLLVVVLGDLPT